MSSPNPVALDPAQLAAWKAQYGAVYALQVDELVGYVRKPTRADIVRALALGKNDPAAIHAHLLENCWLAGNDTIKTDDAAFLAAAVAFGELFPQKTANGWKM